LHQLYAFHRRQEDEIARELEVRALREGDLGRPRRAVAGRQERARAECK
jgi:hypothetical protein